MDYQKGLAPVAIVFIIALLGVFGVAAYRYQNNPTKTVEITEPSPSSTTTASASASATSKASVTKKTSSPSPKGSASPTLTPKPTVAANLQKLSCTVSPYQIPGSGWAPYSLSFTADWKQDPSKTGRVRLDKFRYDLDGDGNWDTDWQAVPGAGLSIPQYTYKKIGSYIVKLQLVSSDGETSDACTTEITIKSPSLTCEVHMDKTSAKAPLAVNFFYAASFRGIEGDDYVTNVQWDFNGDDTWDTPYDFASQKPSYTYEQPGNYTVKMHLQSKNGLNSETCTKNISIE